VKLAPVEQGLDMLGMLEFDPGEKYFEDFKNVEITPV